MWALGAPTQVPSGLWQPEIITGHSQELGGGIPGRPVPEKENRVFVDLLGKWKETLTKLLVGKQLVPFYFHRLPMT